MRDEHKIKEQLINELEEMRQRVAELEAEDTERKRAEEALRQYREHLEDLVEERTSELQQEISERKRAEEAVEQKMRELETFVDNTPHMAWLKDSDSNFILANQAFGDAVGMDPEYLRSHTCAVCFGEEAAKKFKDDDRRVMEGKKQITLEETIVDKDGNEVYLETTKSPIFNEAGDVVGTVGIAIDITERKRAEEALRQYREHLEDLVEERTSELQQEISEREQAEEALRESEEKYRTLVEQSLQGLTVIQDFRIVFANNAFAEISGYTVEELLSLSPEEIRAMVHPEDQALVWGRFRGRLAEKPVPSHYEYRGIRKDGTVRWLEMFASRIKYGGRPAIRGAIVDITERKRAEEEIRQHTAQLEVLRQVGLEITTELDLDILLHSIASRAIELAGGTSGGLYLYRPNRDVLEWSVSVGPDLASVGTVLHRGEGLSGKVWETGEPLIVDDYQQWEGRAAIYEGYPFKATVGVPVRWGEEFLGVLNVLADPPRTFSPADAELLDLFATQAATAIRNARLYEETRQRALEQETVSRIAYALNTPDVRDAYPVLMEGLRDLTGCEVVSLIAMDEAGEQFIVTVLESPFPIPGEGEVMPLSDTAAAEDLEASRPHLTADLSAEIHFPFEQALHQAGLRWWVTLPLLVGGEVFGALNLGGSDTGLFREDQLPVLRQVADALALALQNSFIFLAEREQRELAESLEDATAALTATLDFDQVLDRILEQVSRVVPNDATNIMLIEGDQAHIVRWRGYERFGDEEFVSTAVFHLPERATLQQMMETREPTVVPDTTTDPDWVHVPVQKWLRSYAAAPIIVRGEVIGFLNVDSATSGFFTQAHAEALRAFADHAAAAIENARLYEAEQERRHIAETLRQASTVLSSTLELGEVLELILHQLQQVIPYDSASVQQLQDEHLQIVACQGFEEPDKVVGLVFPLNPKFPNHRVITTKAPLAIEDVVQDYPHFQEEANTYESGRIRSWLGVPLVVKDQVIGMIAMDRAEVQPYTAEEAQLATAFANQAAIAIENARLYGETQQRVVEMEALRRTSLQLTSSLDLPTVLDGITESTLTLVGATDCHIYLYDEMSETFTFGAALWENGRREAAVKTPRRDGFTASVAREGQAVVINDTTQHPLYASPEARKWGLQAIAGFPLKRAGRVLGVFNIAFLEPHTFSEEELRVLGLLADQAAIAIENARLYEETRRRAEEMTALHETTLDITIQLEMQRLLNAIITRASDLLGATGGLVHLYEPARERLVAVTSHNLERDYTGLTLEVGEGVAGKVFETGEALIIDNHRAWAERSPQVEDAFARSMLGVPLRWREQVIGVLDIMDNERVGAFDERDLGLLTLFANQAAIAIENARLFGEERRRSTQLALINEVGEKAASILDLDKLMQEVTHSIQEGFNYYNVALFLLEEERHEVVAQAIVGGFEHITPGKYRQSLDEGIIGFTARTGKSRLVNDVSKDPYYVKGFLDEVLTKSELCVPIKLGDKVIGALDVQSLCLNDFEPTDVVALEAVADRVAIAMENARLYEETQRHSKRLAQTLAVSEVLHRDLGLEQVLDQVVQGAVRLGFHRAVINVCQPEEDLVRVQALAGLEQPDREQLMAATYRWSDFQALMQDRFQVSRSYLIRHEEVDWERDFQGAVVTPSRENHGPGYWHPEDMLLVPLWGTRGQPVGLLSVDEPVDGLLPDLNTIQTLEAFANQAAIAIENARLFEETEHLKTFNEDVVQGVAEAILIEDAQGILTFANPAAEELLGYTREELVGQHWTTIVPEEEVERVQQELAKRPRNIESHYETVLLSKERQVIPVIVSARPLFEEGEFAGVLSAFTDIRERVRREREIEERRLYLEGVLGAAPDAIVTLDARHRVAEWNPGAEKLFGYSREEAIGRNLDHLVTSPDVFEEAVGLTQTAMSGREVPPTEAIRYRKDGSPVDVLLAGSPIMVGDELIGVVAVYTDITARVRMEETLRALALLDELTGLYNRRGFFTLAEQQLKMADRTETKMLLLFADFDDLKWINDTFGHPEGDQTLIEVANVLTETFRESDIMARIGGDEFVVLAIETAEASAEILSTRLQENLEAHNAKGDRRYRLSLSVGIAHYDPGSPCSIDELLARADRAMYEKKQDNDVVARRAVCAEAIP